MFASEGLGRPLHRESKLYESINSKQHASEARPTLGPAEKSSWATNR